MPGAWLVPARVATPPSGDTLPRPSGLAEQQRARNGGRKRGRPSWYLNALQVARLGYPQTAATRALDPAGRARAETCQISSVLGNVVRATGRRGAGAPPSGARGPKYPPRPARLRPGAKVAGCRQTSSVLGNAVR